VRSSGEFQVLLGRTSECDKETIDGFVEQELSTLQTACKTKLERGERYAKMSTKSIINALGVNPKLKCHPNAQDAEFSLINDGKVDSNFVGFCVTQLV
jgi:hypothetical protein